MPRLSRYHLDSQAMALLKLGRIGGSPTLRAWCTSAIQRMEGLVHPRALPITSVQQYPGLQEVCALPKPRMWSFLDEPQVEARVVSLPPLNQVPCSFNPSPVPSTAPVPEEVPPHPAIAPACSSLQQRTIMSRGITKDNKGSSLAAKPPSQDSIFGPASQQNNVIDIPINVPEESSDSEGSLPDIDSGDE